MGIKVKPCGFCGFYGIVKEKSSSCQIFDKVLLEDIRSEKMPNFPGMRRSCIASPNAAS